MSTLHHTFCSVEKKRKDRKREEIVGAGRGGWGGNGENSNYNQSRWVQYNSVLISHTFNKKSNATKGRIL